MQIRTDPLRPSGMCQLVDVLFVCGIYKSGTSLAVHLAEKCGYVNIAKATNPHERGFGITTNRYNTNECSLLRGINENLLPFVTDRPNIIAALEKNNYQKPPTEKNLRMMLDYLSYVPKPVVLKDIRFMYTLPVWIKACKMLGLTYRVVFTHRSKDSLIEAWEHAPFTRKILCGSLLRDFQSLLDLRIRECGRLSNVYSLDDLKLSHLQVDHK